MSAAGGSSWLHPLHFIPPLFPFFWSLQLHWRQLLSRASKCPPAPFCPRCQESKARDSPHTPEADAVGEALALPSAGPQLEQRLCLPRRTWPPGSPVPQAYSSRHALGRSFLLSDPAGIPSGQDGGLERREKAQAAEQGREAGKRGQAAGQREKIRPGSRRR